MIHVDKIPLWVEEFINQDQLTPLNKTPAWVENFIKYDKKSHLFIVFDETMVEVGRFPSWDRACDVCIRYADYINKKDGIDNDQE